jgi:hypothetical protein
MEFTADDVASLGGKLDALDLTDTERGLLTALLDTATSGGDEVAGFAIPGDFGTLLGRITTNPADTGRTGVIRAEDEAMRSTPTGVIWQENEQI